eukprot:TRINITY_DN2825_c1_g1_i1.p1 TRINITY_DN2825_c1_g1~~TRINITY_DN2825_c1_g1_i1.p1  ORF type:complete len:607 (+),score=188.22 TRINITY_DN2825_c1_g1_i1:68-1888(+)
MELVSPEKLSKAYEVSKTALTWAFNYPRTSATAVFLAVRILKKLLSRLPNNVFLEISLDRVEFTEMHTDPMLKVLYKNKMCFISLLNVLEAAGQDSRVKGILVLTGSGRYCTGLAQVEELRNALKHYNKTTGKPVVCYAPTFGEATVGLVDYWMATACTHIVMPNCGGVNITSACASATFLKGLLQKLGLSANLTQRSEFKNAGNMFTEDKMTEAHKEQSLRLLKQVTEMLGEGMRDKNLDPSILEKGPFTSGGAVSHGLIDRIMYYDDVMAELIPELTGLKAGQLNFRNIASYSPFAPKQYQKGFRQTTVAVLTAQGGIHQGKSETLYQGGPSIGSNTLCAQLRSIREDTSIKGLVLRIDSRGGSYVASDLIHHELKKLRAKGIPIIVSMGNVAASGGYYLGMMGQKVFASKASLTGSIGVVNGKVVFREMLEKMGVTVDSIKGGKNSYYFSTVHDFDEEDKKVFEAQTDYIYNDFKNNVGKAINMSDEEVESVAKGQVFFGDEALEKRLVTDIGGYRDALDAMAAELGLASRHKMYLTPFPANIGVGMLLKKAVNREDIDRSPLSMVTLHACLLSLIPGTSFFSSFVKNTVEPELVAHNVPSFL